MKILIIGKNGQIGKELCAIFPEAIALGSSEIDLSKPESIRDRIRSIKPEIIINAAAYTNVDKAEEERRLCMEINGEAPGIITDEAIKINACVIHYSTDYVFNGRKLTPYTEKSKPDPLNLYGFSKLLGDVYVMNNKIPYIILRTSWVYGNHGKNFMLKILDLVKKKEPIEVVCDQIGNPTSSKSIAEATAYIIKNGRDFISKNSGLYNFTSSGDTTWFDFAREILKNRVERELILPTMTVYHPRPARRPFYSILSCKLISSKLGIKISNWKDDLNRILKESNYE